MGEIIARFADGRLLVQEERVIGEHYTSGAGVPIRIGHIKTVERVLSVDSFFSGVPNYRVGVPLCEVKASGDTILVRLRRQDLASGGVASGLESTPMAATGILSGITSGLSWNEELASGKPLSGNLSILANVIGF